MQHPALQDLEVVLGQHQLDARVLASKAASASRNGGIEQPRHAEPHPAADHPGELVADLGDPVDGGQRGPGQRSTASPAAVRLSRARTALEQALTELLLELGHLRADPGLADVHPLSRGPVKPLVDHGDQVAQRGSSTITDASKQHQHLLEFWTDQRQPGGMTTTPMELAETYFAAWQAQDADALRGAGRRREVRRPHGHPRQRRRRGRR